MKIITLSLMITTVTVLFLNPVHAQLKPGFDTSEYIELIKIAATLRALPKDSLAPPSKYSLSYLSPEMGFHNQWALWTNTTGVAVIVIRATVKDTLSALVNMYSAMSPAAGELELEKGNFFKYKLAENPRAAIHTGYLIASGYLSLNILLKIDSCYKQGIKGFLIIGHSQGGSIAYLLTSHFYQLQKEGKLPAGIRFKTYSNAAPKPGNLYFAYDYETMTRGGWAYTVVNTLDAIPETPLSLQTLDDLNEINIFADAKERIKNLKFPQNIVMLYFHHKLNEPVRDAGDMYRKYLGKYVAIYSHKEGVFFTEPVYANTNNYVRTGEQILFVPDPEYYRKFPQDKNDMLINHYFPAYLYLAEKYEAK